MILVKLQMGLVLITSAVSFRQGAEVSRVWNKHEKAPDSGIMTLASHIPYCGCSCLPTSLHPNVPFFSELLFSSFSFRSFPKWFVFWILSIIFSSKILLLNFPLSQFFSWFFILIFSYKIFVEFYLLDFMLSNIFCYLILFHLLPKRLYVLEFFCKIYVANNFYHIYFVHKFLFL